MSDYWVSKKKYFCKYCDIFIADDAPSRKQHEDGLRHKGNKDRFIRDLYKQGEKKKKEKAEADREMKAIDAAATAAYAKDVGMDAASAALASSSASKPPPPPKKPAPSGDKWANYSTAASLGFVDEEADRLAAEAATRQKEGIAGEWSTVTIVPSAPPQAESSTTAATSSTPAKRERSPTPEDPEDTRRFKVRQKMVSVGLGGDLYDPGEIRIKKREDGTKIIRPKVEEPTNATPVPQWKPTQWRRGDPTANEEGVKQEESSEAQVKTDLLEESGAVEGAAVSKTEPQATSERAPSPDDIKPEPQDVKPVVDAPSLAGPSLFKKRKVKSSTAGGRKPI
ncbi:hypothetical protein M407DRAFT_246377 [Tulasnella calospora MUT 4182]|uniref:Matrin-type domain-containing protein n=1 Tax=Tulasnella calospora MUT 4182 TaxID=1051891 RepID=A0A0C3LBF9_9AGAM|nr:hypothetical protein M407DRAFT_246377 [Tulasnella calospora MUT 4182]